MQAKVWNDGDYHHRELFREQTIDIPPHSFIEMDEDQAMYFVGQFYPMAFDADGNDIPIALDNYGKPLIGKGGYKKLRLERIKKADSEVKSAGEQAALKCQSCSFQARSKWELDGHIADVHLAQLEAADVSKFSDEAGYVDPSVVKKNLLDQVNSNKKAGKVVL